MSHPPVLVEMIRAGLVESAHRGHAVLLDADGKIEVSLVNQKSNFPAKCHKACSSNRNVKNWGKT